MTAPTTTWNQRHQAATDACWQGWYRLGLDPFWTINGRVPVVLGDLVPALTSGLAAPVARLPDGLDRDFSEEERTQALAGAVKWVIGGLPWDINRAVANLMAVPEPNPFTPPSAGSWVRQRYLRQHRWSGCWHLFGGDLSPGRMRHTNDVEGRSVCGRRMTLRSETSDVVVADDVPGGDACRKCLRAAPIQGGAS